MTPSLSITLLVLAVLLAADIIVVLYILLKKWWFIAAQKHRDFIHRIFTNNVPHPDHEQIRILFSNRYDRTILIEAFIELTQAVSINPETTKIIHSEYYRTRCDKRAHKRLHSLSRYTRIAAATELSYFSNDTSRCIIENCFTKERNWLVRFYFAYALTVIRHPSSIPLIAESLIGAPEWYRNKVSILICKFDTASYQYIDTLIYRPEIEVCELLYAMAHEFTSTKLAAYLLVNIESPDRKRIYGAAAAMKTRYFNMLVDNRYLNHNDPEIRKLAIEATVNVPTEHTIALLLPILNDRINERTTVNAITTIITAHPGLTPLLINAYDSKEFHSNRNAILSVLSNRAEYLILKLHSPDNNKIRHILTDIISAEYLSTLISFLNRNHDLDLENELLDIIKKALTAQPSIASHLELYLNDRILNKLNLKRALPPPAAPRTQPHPFRRLVLNAALLVLFLSGPALYVLTQWESLFTQPFFQTFKDFIFKFNYVLIYYFFFLNAFYLGLLFLSSLGSLKQARYSRVKKNALLFEKKFMPSISIIAPAYNEEATIIESVNSLLNLWYPEYELIVVNDGSKDRTADTLIDYFTLEKVDIVYTETISTKPLLAIYRNPSLPKLTVINKINGGKADSLNAGINIARGEYVCSIDADSLLEKDALMKIAASSLDIEVETVAAGGNVLPINGCTIRRGSIESFGTPRHPLAVFQMVEYFRAFMAGRIGWASLHCLLIISGAFGLFSRKRIMEIGGYLTSSGQYHQDTVGEDMELVVRLSKHMHEINVPFNINYSYNANCWTEVPEKHSIFFKQRDRWHRGLIEIVSFHHKMIFNRRYGRIGIISLPYFIAFEIFGPWIELLGFISVAAAVSLGLLDMMTVLLLFIATIMTGTFISAASLIIAGQEIRYFTLKETMKLIGYAILENFGFRQVVSLWRCNSYINILRSKSGWGSMVRKGFGESKHRPVPSLPAQTKSAGNSP